ncbi:MULTISPECIES: hypothetical protein [unclassified Ensifer]|uniref:hypothetical protein n=1 Tax=unclassified Ensifer TaxID=2633371 RepID=UPI0011129F93|nr:MULTISPECIES: hypothetical protein [unclassified Ensifer]
MKASSSVASPHLHSRREEQRCKLLAGAKIKLPFCRKAGKFATLALGEKTFCRNRRKLWATSVAECGMAPMKT